MPDPVARFREIMAAYREHRIHRVSPGAFGMVYCGRPFERHEIADLVRAAGYSWEVDAVGNDWIVNEGEPGT